LFTAYAKPYRPERVFSRRVNLICMITRRALLATAPLAFAAPRPFGAVPSGRQIRWHELETTAFLHFGINTFTDKEWGYGDEDPNLFNPTAFDADAIVSALADGGMRGMIITAKHHDGFCLWPTATTERCVRNSPWRSGKGDVVRELSEAAARHGLAFGVYLSPWDRNNPQYGKPAYIDIYRHQLTELLTNYGLLFEVWHDGANGGDGYYGGARERRTIDKRTYYEWPRTWDLVRSLQPGACIFSDVGPDIRWVGNERGIAGDPCWATYDPVAADGGTASPGDVREKESPIGTRNGSKWLPAECDVSIRPGWFWHEREDRRVKTLEQLVTLYYQSVGRGANLLLNVPPNRQGLLSNEDVASLKALGDYRRATFGVNLAARARIKGDLVELRNPAVFDVIRLREDIRYGQRVDSVAIDASVGSAWREIAVCSSVGPRRLVRLEKPVHAERLRLRVQSPAPVIWAEIALFRQP
jgi:alpha-L-fucosidase